MPASSPTQTVQVDGISITFPLDIPSNERAEVLQALYQKHVHLYDRNRFKGPTYACVPKAIADDVADAMDFMGDIVDSRTKRGAKILLHSDGYYAHGF